MRLHLKKSCKLISLILAILLAFNAFVHKDVYSESSLRSPAPGVMAKEKQTVLTQFLVTDEISNSFLADPVINNQKYSFINGPKNVCTNKSMDLLVAIHSYVINFDRRKLARRIRKTRPPIGIIYLFFMGRSVHFDGLQRRVDTEANQHGDIVQADLEDYYRNGSLLSVAILKWVHDFCPQVKYVVKKIDDVQIKQANILRALRHKENDYKHFVMGDTAYLVNEPIKNDVSKYYRSISDDVDIPVLYAKGPMYGFPGKTAQLLYQVILRTKLFWREDVYITGICTHRANIPVFFDKSFLYKQPIKYA